MSTDPSSTEAPDLADGFIVNGTTAANIWSTEIQCVLQQRRQPLEQAVFLSHECRFERVHFAEPDQGIFKMQQPFEFLTFTRDGQFYQLAKPDVPLNKEHIDSVTERHLDGTPVPAAITHDGWLSRVRCALRPIEVLPFAELLDGLRNDRIPLRRLYCRFEIDLGDGLVLYCPARYVNFAHPELAACPYVQVISGTVLLPVNGTYLPGYIACAVNDQGDGRMEFAGLRYVDTFRWLAELAPPGPVADTMAKFSQFAPSYLPVMNHVLPLAGTVTFFRYR